MSYNLHEEMTPSQSLSWRRPSIDKKKWIRIWWWKKNCTVYN